MVASRDSRNGHAEGQCLDGQSLPAAHVGVMEVVSGGEGDNPQGDHQRPDGKNPFADGTVVVSEGRGFANSEDLAAKANGHEHDAERESEPGQRHGLSFYPNRDRCEKRKVRESIDASGESERHRTMSGLEVRILNELGRDFGKRQGL
jgi:hypothetical protein